MACAVEVAGRVVPELFAEALRRVVAEAAGLHTRVRVVGEEPRRLAVATDDWRPALVDVSPDADPEASALAWMVRRQRQPFDPARGPLVDVALIRLASTRWTVYLGYHHLVLDPAGADLLVRRCARVYASLVANEPVGPNPFGAEDELSDVTETPPVEWLTDPPAVVSLADGDRSDAAGTGRTTLEPAPQDLATVGVESLGLLTAVLAAYVARMRYVDDVLVGVTLDGRVTPFDRLVPATAERIAPVRLQLSPRTTWADLVAAATERIGELRQHKGARWAGVWRAAAGRDGGMFTVPVVKLHHGGGPLEVKGCHAVVRHLRMAATEDVALCGQLGADGTTELCVEAGPWRVTDAALGDHRDRLAALLADAVANPDRPVLDAELLTARDRDRALHAWHGPETDLPEGTVADVFERQVARQPDAVAVELGDSRLSYVELSARANHFAGILVARGVRPGDRLGVLMGRSIELVVALLAVAKAGAVYVPLDPRAPVARMRAMLTGVGATMLLVDETTAAHEAAAAGNVLVVTQGGVDLPGQFGADPSTPLYIMHTSGSTGRPKGVVATHRNVIALAMDQAWRSEAHQRVLFHSSHAFDAATYEMWVPLLTGGRVVVSPEDVNAVLLRRLAGEGRVTAMFLTTGLFNALADGDPGCFTGLREVWTGGNVTSPHAVARVASACPDLVIHNVYGPTETTTFATHYRVPRAGRAGALPIGAPMDNTRAYVLDDRLRPLPPGATGTLYLAGAGVALGYAGQPELTRERFLSDPFGPPDSVMYHTGDLVRWDDDGNLGFHGRADEQVKIHGFRIEPGEIEAVLATHPGVAQAVVVARVFADAGGRIDGYVVPADPGDVPDGQSLRDHLAERLPAYMVPERIVAIAEVPLTPNGKIDHRRLAEPAQERPATERALAQMWAELLNVREVPGDASFWKLGGHSLLGVKLVERIRRRFGVDLRLRDLFRHPRLTDLAAVVDAAVQPAHEELPASSFQQRIWLAERLRAEPGLYHVPLAWRVNGRLDPARLASAAATLVERHEALRTTFVTRDDTLCQVIGSPWRPEVSQGHAADEAALLELLRAEAERPFDLATGPLLRLGIVETPTGQVLTLTVHHIVFDVTSAAVLLAELDRCYDGESPATPAPRYRDLLATQRRTDEPALRRRVDALRGAPSRLPVAPPEHTRPHGVVPFALPDYLLPRMRAAQEEHGMSWFMVAAAALAGVLHRWTGSADVTFGFPTDLRTDDFAGVVGPCLNMVVVRSSCDAGTTVAELLTRVRDGVLEAIDDQHVPFESIVDELNPPRDGGSTPYLDVAVGPEVRPATPPVIGGCALAPVSAPLSSTVGKFTIILSLTAAGEQLTGTVSYRGDRVDSEVGDRLPGLLVEMLAAMLTDTSCPVSAIDLDIAPSAVARVTAPVEHRVNGEMAADLEGRVAGIWSSVLAVERVGAQDNFFDLGGNSLKLVALHARLCSEFDFELPIQRLFENATVRAMARFLAEKEEPVIEPVVEVGDRGAARRAHLRRAARAR